MPCRDGEPPDDDNGYGQLADRTAMLCALASALNGQNMLHTVLDSINWHDAGITRSEFNSWWAEHQRADAARLQREDAERQRQARIDSARSKLTSAEFAALTQRF